MCGCGCDGAFALAEARIAAPEAQPLSSLERAAPPSRRLSNFGTGVERVLDALRSLVPVWRSIS